MNRISLLTAIFTSFFALITLVVPGSSQGLGWKVVGTTVDPSGDTTVFEQASNGLKRETKTIFYPGTTKTWTQTVSEISPNGARIVTHKAWTDTGTQKEYYTRTHNEVGAVGSGERWFIDSTGKRFFEKWDTTKNGWMPSVQHADPLATNGKHTFHGIWKTPSDENLGIKVSGNNVIVGLLTKGDNEELLWHALVSKPGTLEGGTIHTTWESGCIAPGWQPKDLPARITISADGRSLIFETVVIECDDKGKMTVTNKWEKAYGTFVKISAEPPTKTWQ